MTVLILTLETLEEFAVLRELAAERPVDARTLMERIAIQGDAAHRAQMAAQTVRIPRPFPFWVTFSIEVGHPVGTCRHLSISVERARRGPHPAAVWTVAEYFGFTGSLDACRCWLEPLSDGRVAVNVVQPVALHEAGNG